MTVSPLKVPFSVALTVVTVGNFSSFVCSSRCAWVVLMSASSFWAASIRVFCSSASLRTSSRVSSLTARMRKRVLRTRMPSVASEYSEPFKVCSGNSATTSSTVPLPGGTTTSRLTRALLGYTVTLVTRLVAIFGWAAWSVALATAVPGGTAPAGKGGDPIIANRTAPATAPASRQQHFHMASPLSCCARLRLVRDLLKAAASGEEDYFVNCHRRRAVPLPPVTLRGGRSGSKATQLDATAERLRFKTGKLAPGLGIPSSAHDAVGRRLILAAAGKHAMSAIGT